MKTKKALPLFGLTLILAFVLVGPSWTQDGDGHTDHDHEHDHGHAQPYEGETGYYLAEHGDFDIGLEEGQLELHIHLGAGAIVNGEPLEEDVVADPGQLIIVATEEAEIRRPEGDLWEPTGVDVNEPVWVLPEIEKEGLPAFGLATEEVDAGVLVDDLVILTLRYIQGPGDFSLWESDGFGLPTFLFSTHEGVTSAAFPAGRHAHYNWGFSAPGDYTLVFEVSAELVEGRFVDTLSVYRFKVTEEPLCLQLLPGDVNGDCVVDEHDLEIVQENLGKTASTWPAEGDHDHDHDRDHGDDHENDQ